MIAILFRPHQGSFRPRRLHKDPDRPDAWNDDHHGYLRVSATATALTLDYVSVAPSPGVPTTSINPTVIDTVTLPVAG